MEDEKEKVEQQPKTNVEEQVDITPADVANNEEHKDEEATLRGENGEPLAKGAREIMYERIRAKRPDAKYDDDEDEYFRQAGEIFDELEKGSKNYEDLSGKFMRRFQDNPMEAQALLDYMDGMPLVAAIRKNMGDEALTIKEGDDGWDEYQKAGEDRKKRFAEQQALIAELQQNADMSAKAFDEFAKENELDDEQKAALWALIQADLDNFSKGKLSKDIYARYRKAQNYDPDVKGAKEQGKVEGRNEKIEAEKKKMEGSGLPNGAAGGNANDKEVDNTPNPTVDFLSKMNRRY